MSESHPLASWPGEGAMLGGSVFLHLTRHSVTVTKSQGWLAWDLLMRFSLKQPTTSAPPKPLHGSPR